MFSQAPLHVSHSTSSHFWGLMRYLFHASLWVRLYSMNNQSRNCSMTVRWVTLTKQLTLHAKETPRRSFIIGRTAGHLLAFISEKQGGHQHLLLLLLSHSFIKNLKAPHDKKHPILCDTYVQLHVSTSLVISDPVILIARKHKAGKIG